MDHTKLEQPRIPSVFTAQNCSLQVPREGNLELPGPVDFLPI